MLASAFGLLLGTGIVLAGQGEVVHFKNGTTMTIRSHEIDGDMVKVDLGDEAYMAFPLDQVEKIETSSGQQALGRSGANQMVPTPEGEISGVVPSRHRRDQWEDPNLSGPNAAAAVDSNGVAVHRPFANDRSSAKRQFGVTGTNNLRAQTPSRTSARGAIGTSRVGRSQVLPNNRAETRRQNTSPGLRGGDAGSREKKK
jgi:hypothetical protein